MSITMTIDIDSAAVTRALETMPAAVDAETDKAMVQSAFIAEAEIKALTPRKTGRLFSAWAGSIRGTGFQVVGVVANRVSYAGYVEEGTGPHEIVAKGKALYWPGARHPVKRVNHPGSRGAHMARLGLTAARPAIIETFRRAMKDAIRVALGK